MQKQVKNSGVAEKIFNQINNMFSEMDATKEIVRESIYKHILNISIDRPLLTLKVDKNIDYMNTELLDCLRLLSSHDKLIKELLLNGSDVEKQTEIFAKLIILSIKEHNVFNLHKLDSGRDKRLNIATSSPELVEEILKLYIKKGDLFLLY